MTRQSVADVLIVQPPLAGDDLLEFLEDFEPAADLLVIPHQAKLVPFEDDDGAGGDAQEIGDPD